MKFCCWVPKGAVERVRPPDASGNLAWRTNRNLKVRFQSNGLNQLTNVSRTGTLTVAGTLAAPSWSAEVTVSGTGLANHRADLYLDGAWASTNGATLADGMNSFTATVTDGGQTSQQTITAFLPASLNFQYDGNGNLTNDGAGWPRAEWYNPFRASPE